MDLRGFLPTSLLDFPDEIAAILFTGGCNFRCPFCHNPREVILDESSPPRLSVKKILAFLEKRKGLLTGVVITGGEPTMHEDLPELVRSLRALGFKVKLDTNGTNPEMLKSLYAEGLLDYVAMDIKAPFAKYAEVAKFAETEGVRESIGLIMKSGVPYEFRSTILPALHTAEDLREMGRMIAGAERYYLQNFRPEITLDPRFAEERAFTEEELSGLLEVVREFVKMAEVRG